MGQRTHTPHTLDGTWTRSRHTHRRSGGDALLQPRGLAYVPVAKLLDLDKASLSDLNEQLRRGINISSRASLETASVMWPSLESFDEVCPLS
jgi:hypothetical protein